jgi:Kef-type K+ transport system membrane component KefB
MADVWVQATIWVGLALLASLLSVWLRLATALSEILVGLVAQALLMVFVGPDVLGRDAGWVVFLANAGAILLTFLAGAELDPTPSRATGSRLSPSV